MYALFMNAQIKAYLRKSTLSQNTKRLYEYHLADLDNWLIGHGLSFQSITDDDLYDWLDEHKDWSDSSRYNAAAACKSFCKYQFGSTHPVLSVRVRRSDPGPQRTLTAEALTKLLSSFDTSTPGGIRNLSLVSLMADTGLRASEVCSISLKYLDLSKNSIKVRIKGGKWAEAVYFDYTASCLETWLSVRPLLAAKGVDNLFVSTGGTKPGQAITRDGLRAIFRRMGENAGLGLISPHDLRRTFATLASQYGAPSRVVQVAGRWSNIAMVERYTKALQSEAIRPYSPVNSVMGVMVDH